MLIITFLLILGWSNQNLVCTLLGMVEKNCNENLKDTTSCFDHITLSLKLMLIASVRLQVACSLAKVHVVTILKEAILI